MLTPRRPPLVALALLVLMSSSLGACLRKSNTCASDADCFQGETCARNGVCAARDQQDMSAADMREDPPDMRVADMREDSPDMREDLPDMPTPKAHMFTERAEHVTIIGDDAGRLDIVMISAQSPPCIIQHTWRGDEWDATPVECGQVDTTWRRPMLWWEDDTLHMLVPETFPKPRVRHLIQQRDGARAWTELAAALTHTISADELAVTVDATATHTSPNGTWLAQTIAREDGAPEVLLTRKGVGEAAWSPPASLRIPDHYYCPDLQVQHNVLTETTHALALCVDDMDETHIFHLVHSLPDEWTRREARPPIVGTVQGPSGLLATFVQGDLWVVGAGERGQLTRSRLIDEERGAWGEAVVIDNRPSSGGHPRIVTDAGGALRLVFSIGDVSSMRAWMSTSIDGGDSWSDMRELQTNTFNISYDLWTSASGVTHMILSDPDALLRYGVLGVDF